MNKFQPLTKCIFSIYIYNSCCKFILIWLDACRYQISQSLINQLKLALATDPMTMIPVKMRLVSAMTCMICDYCFLSFFLAEVFFIICLKYHSPWSTNWNFLQVLFFYHFFLLKCFISTASSPCDVWLHYRSLVSSFWSVVEYKRGKLK
jgi:hypothetical protein